MKPILINKEYVFCSLSEARFNSLLATCSHPLNPLLTFREKEGITLIMERKTADANALHYSDVWKMITLSVHSDLSAIGFLAKITDKLSENKISVNVVSGYNHDHLFVHEGDADKTMKILNELTK